MTEFDRLRQAIDDSIQKVRELPPFSGPTFSTEALKDEVIPILEQAKETIWESKERFKRLDKLNQEIDTVRDEIISPVNDRIESSRRSNSMLGFAGLLVGALSVVFSFIFALQPRDRDPAYDDLFVNLVRGSTPETFVASSLNAPQDPPVFDDLMYRPDSREPLLHSKIELNRLLNVMYYVPGLRVKLTGYTDSFGNKKKNLKRSQERAERARGFLVQNGIDVDRVTTDSRGESQPVAGNSSRIGRELNRRVEINVIGWPKLDSTAASEHAGTEQAGRVE